MKVTILKSTLICVVSICLALVLVGRSKAVVPDALAIWPLDEGEGDRVTDASGNGYGGSCMNGPAWVSGIFGTALDFDGDDDYVIMDELKIESATDQFTMGCWVNPGGEPTKSWSNMLSGHNDDQGQPPARGMSFEQSGAELNKYYVIVGLEDNFWQTGGATTQLETGAWQHFVGVRDGEHIIHYVNGEVSAEGTVTADPFMPAIDNFRIADWARGGRNFKGILDEVFLSNSALSQAEIAAIMDQGLGTAPVSPADGITTWGDIKALY